MSFLFELGLLYLVDSGCFSLVVSIEFITSGSRICLELLVGLSVIRTASR